MSAEVLLSTLQSGGGEQVQEEIYFIVHQRSMLRHDSSDERRVFCVCALLMSSPLLILALHPLPLA